VKPFTDTFTMISHSFIVSHTRQIHKRLDAASSATTNVTNSNNNIASKADSIEEDMNEHEIQVAATNESVGNADLGIEQVKDNMCNSGHIEEDEDDGTEIRSRAIWHEFHNTPLKKDCLASPSIFILLRVATQTINKVEEDRVKHVLASKGIEEFEEHFFFYKDWWYQKARLLERT